MHSLRAPQKLNVTRFQPTRKFLEVDLTFQVVAGHSQIFVARSLIEEFNMIAAPHSMQTRPLLGGALGAAIYNPLSRLRADDDVTTELYLGGQWQHEMRGGKCVLKSSNSFMKEKRFVERGRSRRAGKGYDRYPCAVKTCMQGSQGD